MKHLQNYRTGIMKRLREALMGISTKVETTLVIILALMVELSLYR